MPLVAMSQKLGFMFLCVTVYALGGHVPEAGLYVFMCNCINPLGGHVPEAGFDVFMCN